MRPFSASFTNANSWLVIVMFDPRLIDRCEALRVARRMSPSQAEDLLQAALLRAWANREQYRSGVGMTARAWFYRLMRNVFISERRRAATEQAHASDLPSWGREVATEIQPMTEHDRMLARIAALPEPMRQVVQARVVGSSYDEIARELGIPVGTVMSRLFRARERLA